MQNLKVAFTDSPSGNLALATLLSHQSQLPCAVEACPFQGVSSTEDTKGALQALTTGKVDTILHWLNELPIRLAGGSVLTAVLPRVGSNQVLMISPDALNMQEEFWLKSGCNVQVAESVIGAQLAAYRPDLKILTNTKGATSVEAALYAGEADAIILPSCYIHLDNYRTSLITPITIDPSELTPTPGTGVAVLETLTEHLQVRTMLKSIHHGPTSQCTNIERGFERSFAEGEHLKTIAAHCHRDHLGNYHAYFCILTDDGLVLKHRISQSTVVGMLDEAVKWGKNAIIEAKVER